MCRLNSILNLNRVHTLYELTTLNVDRTVHMHIVVKIDKQHKQSTEYSHILLYNLVHHISRKPEKKYLSNQQDKI